MHQETNYDVVVIGAGIIGCATAYHLAGAGLRVAILDTGVVAGEASSAAAGMLAPISDEPPDHEHPVQQLGLAALRYYDGLDAQLKQETGVDIGLVDAPTLRPAFDEKESARLQAILRNQHQVYPDLEWEDASRAFEREPLLPEALLGALVSPSEKNVQAGQVTLAYARGAVLRGARLIEGCPAGRLIVRSGRASGVETAQGPKHAGAVVLSAGAWTAQWHTRQPEPPVFPQKGQMLALRALPDRQLRHSVQAPGIGGIVPKADGLTIVGATVEQVGFDRAVTADGLAILLSALARLTPGLRSAQVVRTWAGLRPGSIDGRPLIGASKQIPGLWVGGGHARDGILWGPLTGQIIADLLLERPLAYDIDLQAFDPDRFGGWETGS
jgi:glycine oxidase